MVIPSQFLTCPDIPKCSELDAGDPLAKDTHDIGFPTCHLDSIQVVQEPLPRDDAPLPIEPWEQIPV